MEWEQELHSIRACGRTWTSCAWCSKRTTAGVHDVARGQMKVPVRVPIFAPKHDSPRDAPFGHRLPLNRRSQGEPFAKNLRARARAASHRALCSRSLSGPRDYE